MKQHLSLTACLLASAALVSACAASPSSARNSSHGTHAQHAPVSDNLASWPGTYRGVLPCADCEGIETIVTLDANGSYRMQEKYLGKNDQAFTQQGRITWNKAGADLTLEGDPPARYAVKDNALTRLNTDGSPVTGDLASHYLLTKDGP